MQTLHSAPRSWLSALLCTVAVSATAAAQTTPPTYDLANHGNWSFRFDGAPDIAQHSSALGYAALAVGDIVGNDGKSDIVVAERRQDPDGVLDAGALYLIEHSLFASHAETGNIIDMSDSNNYTLRLDGAAADDETGRAISLADFDQDGALDLVFASYTADPNGVQNAGAVYLIYGRRIQQLIATCAPLLPCSADLSDPTSFNLRFDGADTGGLLGAGSTVAGDLDGDGKSDLLMGTYQGKLYLAYNTLIDDYPGTGNVLDLAASTSYNLLILNTLAQWPFPFTYVEQFLDALVLGDINGNGKLDIAVGAPYANRNDRFFSGSAFVLLDDRFSGLSGTGNLLDLTQSSSFSLRYDGAIDHPAPQSAISTLETGSLTEGGGLAIGDLDGDAFADLIFTEQASENGRPQSGTLYVVDGALAMQQMGSAGYGVIVDLAAPGSHSVRFDGAEAFDRHVSGAQAEIADLDNDGLGDIVLSAVGNILTHPESHPGKVYVIFSQTLEELRAGSDVAFDLDNPKTFDVRYDAEADGDWLGGNALVLADVDDDGLRDVLMPAWGADVNGDTSTGSVYVVRYFPHTLSVDPVFSHTSGEPFDVTGEVDASNNPTRIAAVQWGHHRSFGDPTSPNFHDQWWDCKALDGAFDSNREAFLCPHSALDTNPGSNFQSPHTVFFRSRDEKGIYTPIDQYPERTFVIDSPISNVASQLTRDGLRVTWQTTEPGTSRVEYRQINDPQTLLSTPVDPERVLSHGVTLPCSCFFGYELRVISLDVAGNVATGDWQSAGPTTSS